MTVWVISAPRITFRCDACDAENEGDKEDFVALSTMPPTWIVKCAFCRNNCVCSPKPLVVSAVAAARGG